MPERIRKTGTPTHELGILFIHGIGEQTTGQTLLDVAEPLYEWFRRWIEGADLVWDRLKTREAPPLPERPYPDASVALHKVVFQPDLPTAPARATLQVTVRANDEVQPREATWLLAESHWADSFPQPSFAEVTGWSMRAVPWVLASFFGRRIRITLKDVRLLRDTGEPFTSVLGRVCQLAFYCLLGFFVAPLAFAVVLFLFLLLLLYAIPITAVRSYLTWIQKKISAVIGDSYSFAESHFRREAVVHHVGRNLRWLERRCQKVIVVAHSQGAAVAYLVVKRYPSPRLAALVTFGSGLLKLTQLSNKELPLPAWASFVGRLYGGRSGRTLALLDGFAVLTAVSVVQSAAGIQVLLGSSSATTLSETFGFSWLNTIEAVGSAWVHWSTPFAGLVMFAGVLWAGTLEDLGDITKCANDLESQSPGFRWYDFYASSDPVPNGPLFIDRTAAPAPLHSEEVRNLASLVHDHTSYRENITEFVTAVAQIILRTSTAARGLERLTPVDEAAIGRAAAFRRRRVRGFWLDNLLTLSLLTVLINDTVLRGIGAWVRRALNPIGSRGAAMVYDDPQTFVNWPGWSNYFVGGLAVLMIFFAARSLTSGLWQVNERAHAEMFFLRFLRLQPFDQVVSMLRHGAAAAALGATVYAQWSATLNTIGRIIPIELIARHVSGSIAASVAAFASFYILQLMEMSNSRIEYQPAAESDRVAGRAEV